MSEHGNYLAFDYGAESGRAVLGRLRGGRINLEEVHRFPNTPRKSGTRLEWDAPYLFRELKRGLSGAAAKLNGEPLRSLGVDTWGVDFALLNRDGEMLENPVHYRDPRTDGILDRAFGIVPREDIFRRTGLQFLQFNTLFQLFAMRLEGSAHLDAAARLLMMPDLLNYWLTGERAQEFTNATTTQCYDPSHGDWAWSLIEAFQIPTRIFGPISPPGTVLGPLQPEISEPSGLKDCVVALPATHDTGSAFIAVPLRASHAAIISCGTWSLVGTETARPVMTPEALAFNFTNEGGAFGTNRLLTNVMGLWLLQESRRRWARDGNDLDYAEITEAAATAPAFEFWIDPDDSTFLHPPDMVEAIGASCHRTGQRAPASVAEVGRCVLDSLALKYRQKIEQAEILAGRPFEVIHIVGGGSRNALLCQTTADVCQRPVVAGPAEATAMGNLLVQAAAMGAVRDLGAIREIVRNSSEIRVFEPANRDASMAAYERFRQALEKP